MSKRPDPTPWRAVHGILLLDKAQGPSSNHALQQVKRLFRAEKAGHTGSLDPMATGLLPLCFGEATKIAGYLLGADKAYTAEIRLGLTTATGDALGDVVCARPVPAFDRPRIEAAMAALRGRITQVPPAYSAIKQDGERLYAKARRGETVSVPPREVDVHRFALQAVEGERLQVEVECGSGTYIRSLAVDLGEALGCGAHLTQLRRCWVAPFRTPRMYTWEELAERAGQGDTALDACLLSLEEGLADMPALHLDDGDALRLRQGQAVVVEAQDGLYRVHGGQAGLIALGVVEQGMLRTQRGLNTAAA